MSHTGVIHDFKTNMCSMAGICVPFASIWVLPRLLMGSVFCLVYFCFACLRTVCFVFELYVACPMDCPFLTAPSNFSNINAKESMVILYIRLGVPWTHLYYRIRVMVPRTTTVQLYRWLSVFLVKETELPGEKHRTVASHWQRYHITLTFRHSVVSSVHTRDPNSQR